MIEVEQVPSANWQEWADENNAVLLDIRESNEWELGTLPGAQLLAMTEIMEKIDEIPQDRTILCICRGGGRSQQVAMFLAHNGYKVANLDGGMHALGLQD